MSFIDDWVVADSNSLNIQGMILHYSDGDGREDKTYFSSIERTGMCATGTVAQAIDLPDEYDTDDEVNWVQIYGVAIGFSLCQEIPEAEGQAAVIHPIGDCPLNENLATEYKGISFELTGDIGPVGMRVAFYEPLRDNGIAYVEIPPSAGEYTAMMANAGVWYSDGKAVNVDDVTSMHFTLPVTVAGSYPFDFCVSNIRAVTE